MNEQLIKLTFDELKACQLALLEMKRDMLKAHNDPRIPWSPQARQTQKEIRTACNSAIQKISKHTGIPAELPDIDGIDHSKYLTKES